MTHLQTSDLACNPLATLEYAKMCITAALHLNSTRLTTTPRDSADITAGLDSCGCQLWLEESEIHPENQVTALLAVLQRLLVTGCKQTGTSIGTLVQQRRLLHNQLPVHSQRCRQTSLHCLHAQGVQSCK